MSDTHHKLSNKDILHSDEYKEYRQNIFDAQRKLSDDLKKKKEENQTFDTLKTLFGLAAGTSLVGILVFGATKAKGDLGAMKAMGARVGTQMSIFGLCMATICYMSYNPEKGLGGMFSATNHRSLPAKEKELDL